MFGIDLYVICLSLGLEVFQVCPLTCCAACNLSYVLWVLYTCGCITIHYIRIRAVNFVVNNLRL